MTTTTNYHSTAALFRVLHVLAGAYRGRDTSRRTTLSHAVPVDDSGTAGGGANAPICRSVPAEHMADDYVAEPAGTIPTCQVCAARLRRMSGVVIAGPKS